MTEPVLRPANEDDEALLLEWRNDPETRRQSLQQAPVTTAEHARWLRERLARRSECRIYVAEVDGAPVGQARVDRVGDDRGEISVALSAASRGRGLGRALIAKASQAAVADLGVRTVTAIVKSQNAASLRAFEAAGYRDPVTTEREGEPVLLLAWKAPTLVRDR